MESEFRTKPPRSDPDRWKPHVRLVLLAVVTLPFAFLEYQLVEDVLRFGRRGALVQAILYGLLLVWMLYLLILGLWRLLNPPTPAAVLAAAQATLKHELPADGFTSRSRVRVPPNKYLYAALPTSFVLLGIYGVCIDRIEMFFITLAIAAVFGALMFYIFHSERQQRSLVVTVRPAERKFVFEHAAFIATFHPTKAAVRTELPFDDILGIDYYPGGRGPATLSIRSIKGSVVLTDQLENFERIHAIANSIVILNKSDQTAYQEKLNAEPEIKTPWYGWIILIVVIGIVVFLGWKFMYSEH